MTMNLPTSLGVALFGIREPRLWPSPLSVRVEEDGAMQSEDSTQHQVEVRILPNKGCCRGFKAAQ